MGWQEDLKDLLGDVGGTALDVLDLPGSVGRGAIGSLVNVAQGEGMEGVGLEPGQEEWNQSFKAFRQADLGPLGILKAPVEIGANVLADPTTYLGVGLAGKAARLATEAGRPLLGAGLQAVQRGYSLPGEIALEKAIQPTFRAVAKGITKLPGASNLLENAPETQMRNIFEDITQADLERLDVAGLGATPPIGRLAHKQRLSQGLTDPLISDEANDIFSQTLKDGTTYGQALQAGEVVARKDMDALAASGVTWEPGAHIDTRVEALEAFPDLQTQIKKYAKLGIDPMHAEDPRNVARLVLSKTIAEEAGIKHARTTWPSLLKSAWVEQVLTTVRYPFSNLFGNSLMMAAAGYVPPRNWREYRATLQAVQGGEDVITRADAMKTLYGAQKAAEYGQALPERLVRGGIKDIELGGTRRERSAIGEVVGRATTSQRAARVAGWLPNQVNDYALTFDVVPRVSLWTTGFVDGMEKRLPQWEQEVRDAGRNIPGFQGISKSQGLNVPAEGMFSLPVKNELMRQGMQDGPAEHLARSLANIRKAADKEGQAIVDKVMFSWDRTNLDMLVGKVIPFHYWMSRSVRFWGEEAAQNPALAVNYMKYTEGMEDADNDPGLDARQKGFLHVLGTPLGFSLLANPDAMLGFAKFLDLDQAIQEPEMVMDEDGNMVPRERTPFVPEGQTRLGGALVWMKDHGIGLYPWIDGTLNLLGVYGNTFEPDLLGIRHKTLIGAAANTIRAHLGMEPWGAPYANAMGQLRSGISSAFGPLAPDWLAQPVAPRPGNSTQEATLDIAIENRVATNNPGLTNADLLEVMADQDHPEYKKAYREVADAGIVEQLLNFTVPIQFKIRQDAPDVRVAQLTEIREASKAKNVAPFRFTPTPGDIEFAARYKRLTGKEWRPQDYEDAKSLHDLVRAPEAAKPMIVQADAYYNLGTPEQQALYTRFQELTHGDDPLTAGIESEGARYEAARTWLSRQGKMREYDDLQAQRRNFEATHPEFGEYIGWRDQMYALKAQLGGNLGEYRRQAALQNPNAARYFEQKWAWILQTFPEDEWEEQFENATLSAAAFNAITGKGTLRSVQGPIPGVPAADVTLPTMAAAIPQGGGGYNWSQELRNITRV